MSLDEPMAELPSFPPLPGAVTENLTSKEKAAIVVRLLLSQGALPALSQLSETKQTQLAVQIARMAPVDQETVQAVAEEFASEIERIALSFPQGLDGALGLLDGVLSEGAAERLRKMAPSDSRRNAWDDVEKADVERLVPILEAESLEVAAVILSKLPTGKAAEVLGKLPGELARRITIAITQTADVAPMVVHRIGVSLAEQLDARPITAFDDAPVSRVGAILNYAPASVRDGVLEGIEQEDKDFADEVRAAIFTFANIPERIAPRDVPRIQRDLDQDDLTLVIAGANSEADKASVEFILENISKRMAENMRDDAKELADPKQDDVEAAMIRIVGVIRDLETQGEIFFVLKEE
ncbi:MAG: FliG C-terminal domain-containing protein [Paracoccaceae bacterium]|nr:FliG C-terminal domain-containing protein [Paracoccaceae bacterium]